MARCPHISRTGARATVRNRGRRRGPASRRSCARTFVIGAISLAALGGCAVQPEPLTPAQTALRVETDLTRLAAGQPLLNGPLTLHGAMARAILHNPDVRVQAMEESLALRQVDQARLGLLPALTGRYGVETRSNAQASSSRSAETGRESLTASTSTDRTRRSRSLAAVWQMLDFGVSYYGAKQQSDRALIVHERRRKAVHAAVAEVRHAWWQAVAAERALARLEPLLARVRAALADSGRLAARQLQAPVKALRYQRALLEAVDALERQRRESRLAKIEVARLIGLPPDADYTLAVPAGAPDPRALAVTADELAALALAHRPELREGQLDERIAVHEVRKAMLRLLPGLELRAGGHVDSNSYLVNNDWLSLGAAVSVNLTELFTGPAAINAAQAGRELAASRREALSMAALCSVGALRGGACAACDGGQDCRYRTAHRRGPAVERASRRGRPAADAARRDRCPSGPPDARSQPGRGRRQFRADLPCSGRRHPAGRTGETDAGGCRRIDRRHRGGLEPR